MQREDREPGAGRELGGDVQDGGCLAALQHERGREHEAERGRERHRREQHHLADVEWPHAGGRVDAVAHRTARERAPADRVADRRRGERAEHRPAGRDGPVKEARDDRFVGRERGEHDEHQQATRQQMRRVDRAHLLQHAGDVDAVQRVQQHRGGEGDDARGDGDRHELPQAVEQAHAAAQRTRRSG